MDDLDRPARRLQRDALADSKADKAEDSSIHCSQLVDYLTNRVRAHVPVENPIWLAALGRQLARPRVDLTCRNRTDWFRFF